MKGKRAGFLIGGLVFALALILLIFRGVAVKKKEARLQRQQQENMQQYLDQMAMEESQQNNDNAVVGLTDWGNTGNGENPGLPNSSTGVSAEVLGDINGRQSSQSGFDEEGETDTGDSQDGQTAPTNLSVAETLNNTLSLQLVDRVEVQATYEANVLVSAKSIYKVGESCYAYAISMIIPVEGKGYQLIDYLCSVATWNSVNNGDSIVVTYGLDENGVVIIKGLSK